VDGEVVALPAGALTLQLSGKAGYAVAEQGGYLVALPTDLTDELKDEGLARELAHRLNTMRKAAGFDIADWITTDYVAGAHVARVLREYAEYIKSETLSRTLRPAELDQEGEVYRETVTVDGEEATFILRR
jgi:isoleucyl-tRNA synthetase